MFGDLIYVMILNIMIYNCKHTINHSIHIVTLYWYISIFCIISCQYNIYHNIYIIKLKYNSKI